MYTQPILYLGKDRVDKSYYFLGNKGDVGRFIKFTSYPYWCRSDMVGNFLDIGSEVPVEVLEEIMLFVNGVINYELLPKTRGRSESVIRHDTRSGDKTRFKTDGTKETVGIIPKTGSQIQVETGNVQTQGDLLTTSPKRRRTTVTELQEKTSPSLMGGNSSSSGHCFSDTVRGTGGGIERSTTIDVGSTSGEGYKPKRIRRTRAQIEADNLARSLETMAESGNQEVKPILLETQPVPEKRGRGRPKKILGTAGSSVSSTPIELEPGSVDGTSGLQTPVAKRSYRRKLKEIS